VSPLTLTESGLVFDYAIHHREWLLARECAHQVIASRADSIATILGNVARSPSIIPALLAEQTECPIGFH